jgi:hypothetical protein
MSVYVWESETAICTRCGVARQVRTGRPISDVCRDCKTQQTADDKAWLAFHPCEPMSAADIAWCERQVENHKRLQTERANRAGWYTRERVA